MGALKHVRQRPWGVISLLPVLLSAMACGGGEDVVQGMPPSGSRRPAQAATTSLATSATSAPAEQSRRGITQLQFEGEVRDPFLRYFPDESEIVQLNLQVQPLEQAEESLGPLANYSLEQLQLVGIISRTAEPRAMFRIPQSSQMVFARVDDRVGPNGTGRISDIQPNRVVVTYENIMLSEDQAQTVELMLRDPRQQLEAQFDPY
ncbi:MAG: pilus assembly protein PilP [Bradymonadales bacterium]|nr:pilus assembly protein PilP [Bradymonadales bacterium]